MKQALMKIINYLKKQLNSLKSKRRVEMREKIVNELLKEIEIKKPRRIKIGIELEKVPALQDVDFFSKIDKITYKSTFAPYIYMEVDVEKIEEISKLSFVKKIWHVPEVKLLAEAAPLEAAQVTLVESCNYIQADIMHSNGIWGEGINIGVVDSGIDVNHPMFKDAILKARNFTSSDPNDIQDRGGHGTWCASACAGRYWISPEGHELQGMAPKAKLIIARIFADGSTSIDTAMAGLEWAVKEGAHVVSNSWGGSEYQPLHDLIKSLVANYDCAIVAAAGNSGPDYKTIAYPGGYKEVLCVGALAVKNPAPDSIAAFSSRGPSISDGEEIVKPDVCAPGGNAIISGQGADECIIGAGINSTSACFRGTSMATPHAAGALALLREYHKDKDAKFCMEALMSTCLDLMALGKDNDSGFGRIRVAEGMKYIHKPVYGIKLEVLDKYGNDLQGKSISEYETITIRGIAERHDGGRPLLVELFYKRGEGNFKIESILSDETGYYQKSWQIPDLVFNTQEKISFFSRLFLDVEIISARVYPSEVCCGDPYTVEVEVKNLNPVDLDFDIIIGIGDATFGWESHSFLNKLIPANSTIILSEKLSAPLTPKTFDLLVQVMEINEVTYEKLVFREETFPKILKVIEPQYSTIEGITGIMCPKLCVSGINQYCIGVTAPTRNEIFLMDIYKNGVRVWEWTNTRVPLGQKVYLDNRYFYCEYLEYLGGVPEKGKIRLGSRKS